ncbi:hypothetical protein NW766_007659 [Fusarium irregulare]|uniref:Protein NO VEIN C-terminal domain-containing protein n=1 Tax=Fusarium irregulare TaxID=2494466 RepID=A0A9W8PLD8_9HYPO|nr:hypothetical protein NW766_007659 [Fusarium irregulare]
MYYEADWETVTQQTFEETPLIFVRQQGVPGWYRTSECLWSSETSIRGKVTLDDTYEELKDFFVHDLGVKSLTLQMVYDELKQSRDNSPEYEKVLIRSLNEFLQLESRYIDPDPIRKAKVFPIRHSNGTVSLGSIDVAFAIGDRAKLKTAFEDKVSLLDFDLEDVRRLKPLFEWLRLQGRYLSNCVQEETSISTDSGRLILSGKRFLKAKAYHITRPRFRENRTECYEALRTMDVREVDEISSVLKMNQNGHPAESRVATASEHISEIGGKLTIYVAKEPKAQDISFGSVLPRKLASWLMMNPNTNRLGSVEAEMVSALTSIFASDKSVLDEILDDQGIIQIPFDNDDEDESLRLVEEQSMQLVLTPTDSSEAEASSNIPHNTDTFETEIETMSQTSHMTHQGRRAVERHSPDSTAALRPSLNDSVPNLHFRRNLSSGLEAGESVLQEDVRYRSILERVVEAARSANFPHGGAFDMQDLRDALPDANLGTYQSFDGLDVMESMGSSSQQERDKRVGAAGELYVRILIFELLSKLELPGWGRGNWQSTIRKYATVHPDYADLSHWSRRETADLVYIDASGRFTNTLIEAGILTADEWSGKQPTYYFEVKTTTGPCKTPFYMSGNQYHLVSSLRYPIETSADRLQMERIHYNGDRSEVYMIFRIYSLLDGGRINYCVYMDPKKLRDEGRLVFTEGTWSVRPGSVVEQE